MSSASPFQTPEYYQLLLQLQEVDFTLLELNLYLDTHPQDVQAIQQFNHYVQERTKLAKVYVERYGPLQNFGRDYSGCPWTWAEVPWPWQV
ncbi:spore coat protein CotJB [Paenibacillus sp. 481]|uniref:spore coat protein CotJB n=1 Tax=Paenibacillus sp. 481 TaxID=2835869 RepID=UPI001E3BA03E|nr:spore coat protein CotJB [Paenibacillus sp. 481]UHA73996.1 spore coat protein CotJB [Paenibacillus sp. 481]